MRPPANRLNALSSAPGDLRIVQGFVNTADLQAGTDALASPAGLADWLVSHALLPPGSQLEDAGARRAIEFRERLRAMLRGGESASRELGAAVDETLASALVCSRFEAGGVLHLAPANAGLDGALGRLLAIIAAAQRDGHWSRFKICASVTCRAAFYDHSTNRTGLWCLPNCGSLVRGQEYRRRQKQRRR